MLLNKVTFKKLMIKRPPDEYNIYIITWLNKKQANYLNDMISKNLH